MRMAYSIHLLTRLAAVPVAHSSGISPSHGRHLPTDLVSYVCGQRWKTCECAQWDEDRLTVRANQVLARGQARVGVVARD